MSELPVTASGWPMSDTRIRFCADGCGRPQCASGVRIRRLEIHMAASKSAPYGSWKSPITSDLIVAQSITLTEVRLDGRNIYWLEGRPQEQGRYVVVRADKSRNRDVVPKPMSARTRVHEYGGGSWTVDNGITYFSNFADGRLYRRSDASLEAEP